MKVTCKELVDFMESIAPPIYAEHWDNVGLMLGSTKDEVERILLCLDVTTEVVKEAMGKNAEMIISHHPLIFKELDRILENDKKGRILYSLIRNGICVYSSHTNLDVVNDGVNRLLAEKLGLFDPLGLKGNKPLFGNDKYFGLGAVGKIQVPMNLPEFIDQVKKSLDTSNVRVVGNVKGLVEKVAVFCGSFDGDLDSVYEHETDVLVTGDLKYHTAVDAIGMNMCIIDAGHFNTENIVIPHLARIISREFPDIEVICNNVENDPFKTY